MTKLLHKIRVDKNRNVYSIYLCKCGKVFETRDNAVRSGHTKSCGCYKASESATRLRTHGMSSTSEFHTWQQMIQRCTNPSNTRYRHYGARGITVCLEWVNSFEAFLSDMGYRPVGFSLDRIDNNMGYSNDNCRWADIVTQNNNKRQRRPNASKKEET